MMDSVEEFRQVKINHPFVAFLQILLCFGNGCVAAHPGTKAVATLMERRLKVWAEHLQHSLLYNSIDDIGYPEAALCDFAET